MGVRAEATAAGAWVSCGALVGGSQAQGCRSLKNSEVSSWLGCPTAWGCGVPGCEQGSGLVPPSPLHPCPSTILVEPGCQAEVTETGDIRISVGAEAPSTVGTQLDPIQLSIFSHRFMSIAGEWLPLSFPTAQLWCRVEGSACWAEVGTGGVAGRGVQRKCDPGEGAEAESLLATGWAVWPWPWDGTALLYQLALGRVVPFSYWQPCALGLPTVCEQETGSAQ